MNTVPKMNYRAATAFFLMLVLPVALAGQVESGSTTVFDDYLNRADTGGFLRIPGLGFHSSAGFSFFSSGEYGSQGTGFYTGHFDYMIGSSLTLHWDVGIRSAVTGPGAAEGPGLYFPNLDITYRPSDKLLFRVQVGQYDYFNNFDWRRF